MSQGGMSRTGRLRARLLGIDAAEASCARRGFQVADAAARTRLEEVGRAFLAGYHAALEENGPAALEEDGPAALEEDGPAGLPGDRSGGLPGRLAAVPAELRGFAFEGAAMGLALLDQLTPWRRGRLRAFVDGPARPHVYMAHVGAGWATARLPWRPGPQAWRLDPLLGWLAVDGYGFHEGYFHWPTTVAGRRRPAGLTGYAARAFDQGLGRSLWFVMGADVARVGGTVVAFPPERQADLWSGVGLACAYAGPTARADLEALRAAAGRYRPEVAQGVVFAAAARRRAGNPAPHTDFACAVLLDLPAEAAAAIADEALAGLPTAGPEPGYEVWRRRIRTRFAREVVTA